MIPAELIEACESNAFVWHREPGEDVERAFDELSLEKRGEFFEFSSRYCLQFVSDTLPFEMVDFVEEDGQIADVVDYAQTSLVFRAM